MDDSLKVDDMNCSISSAECHEGCSHRTTSRTQKTRNALITRLNRIEGQVRGIKGMIEKDVYCDDILNQISAVNSALKSVSRLLLEGHLKNCLLNRIQAGEKEVLDELLETIEKMMR